jgi:ornithine cyclodeaminase/alanine dehydrogenase-like protein (mu-crystallin family)
MALLLRHEEVRDLVSMQDAIEAMELAFAEEAAGAAILPQRTNMAVSKGWLRVGPVALEKSGVMGFKAMNLCPGAGVRYQVHLFAIDTGELLSIMDAQYLTTLRTGATSAVATRRLARPGPAKVALLGSGAEARAQLEAMHAAGFVKNARVFSLTKANREKLAQDFHASCGIEIEAVETAEEAVRGSDLVLAAVKATTPVLLGEWLKPGMHINSVGTARRDQRELDAAVFERSHRIVLDTRRGVLEEAGDAVAARERIDDGRVKELCEIVGGVAKSRRSPDEITLFKSVGTGIQDIALANAIYRNARERKIGSDLGPFPYAKKN